MKHFAMALINLGMFGLCAYLFSSERNTPGAIFAVLGVLYAFLVAGVPTGPGPTTVANTLHR